MWTAVPPICIFCVHSFHYRPTPTWPTAGQAMHGLLCRPTGIWTMAVIWSGSWLAACFKWVSSNNKPQPSIKGCAVSYDARCTLWTVSLIRVCTISDTMNNHIIGHRKNIGLGLLVLFSVNIQKFSIWNPKSRMHIPSHTYFNAIWCELLE